MVHALPDGLGMRPVSAVAVYMPAIAVGTKRMELVIATETECPPGLASRPGPIAGVAAEVACGVGGVADPRTGSCTVQAREHLFKLLSQFPQLLSKLVQCRLGRRAAFNARAVASPLLVLR